MAHSLKKFAVWGDNKSQYHKKLTHRRRRRISQESLHKVEIGNDFDDVLPFKNYHTVSPYDVQDYNSIIYNDKYYEMYSYYWNPATLLWTPESWAELIRRGKRK